VALSASQGAELLQILYLDAAHARLMSARHGRVEEIEPRDSGRDSGLSAPQGVELRQILYLAVPAAAPAADARLISSWHGRVEAIQPRSALTDSGHDSGADVAGDLR
jgi:hypothetical protein